MVLSNNELFIQSIKKYFLLFFPPCAMEFSKGSLSRDEGVHKGVREGPQGSTAGVPRLSSQAVKHNSLLNGLSAITRG